MDEALQGREESERKEAGSSSYREWSRQAGAKPLRSLTGQDAGRWLSAEAHRGTMARLCLRNQRLQGVGEGSGKQTTFSEAQELGSNCPTEMMHAVVIQMRGSVSIVTGAKQIGTTGHAISYLLLGQALVQGSCAGQQLARCTWV